MHTGPTVNHASPHGHTAPSYPLEAEELRLLMSITLSMLTRINYIELHSQGESVTSRRRVVHTRCTGSRTLHR
jgi:hypothetical protein